MDDPCPICASTARREFNGRPRALCADCGALERQRALAGRFGAALSGGNGRACLEIGPLNRRVFGEFLASRGWSYRSVDRWRSGNPHDPRDVSFVSAELDLCDLSPIVRGTFDVVIAQHVIEEIHDFRRALDEVARVLTPNGLALLDVPFTERLERSQAQVADHFGNVWTFGTDLIDELQQRFGAVDVVRGAGDDYPAPILAAQGPVRKC